MHLPSPSPWVRSAARMILRRSCCRLAVVLGLVAALSPAAVCSSSVYRFVSREGVEAYTDCPVEEGGTLILRDVPAVGGRSGVPGPTGSASGPGSGGLPVDGVITSLYGLRHDPIDGVLRRHEGIDIAVPEGTPVHPIAPGRVVFSGQRSGYGNTVIVAHGDGRITLYAHNAANWVREGEPVEPGDILALSGSTGRSTGPHVHFAVWRDGVNVTDTFLHGVGGSPAAPGRPDTAGEDVIRRILQADGSVLYTNLPIGHR